MSGGGGKGGKQKVEQKMDPQALAMIKEMSAFGKEVAKMPYMPWQGNDVAAFTPQQTAGMQAFADMGNSFGMGMPADVSAGMPTAKTDASGVTGYSSYPAYKEAAAKSAMDNPDAARRYSDFFDLPVSSLFGGANVPGGSPAPQPTRGGKGPNPFALKSGSSGSGSAGSKGPGIFGGLK